MYTAQQVLDLFKETGTDIYFGAQDGESAIQRAQRIAGELNSGRSMDNLMTSLEGIRMRGGTYVMSDAERAEEKAEADKTLTAQEQRRELSLTYGWLPDEAIELYIGEYIESGNSDAAWAVIRQDSRYEQWFPGNLTEDGRVRYSEAQYGQVIASYDDVFRSVGLNPDLFKGNYGDLISGDVSPEELEMNRIQPMYRRIVEGSTPIKEWYSNEYGIEMTTEALLAAAIDPSIGSEILTGQISLAEIGGEAGESGFDIDQAFATRLYEAGMDRDSADRMFQKADQFLPVLNTLAARHADADDEFDLNEFVAADLFGDPAQRTRMNRLLAQERSSFTQSAERDYLRDERTGGVAGLAVT